MSETDIDELREMAVAIRRMSHQAHTRGLGEAALLLSLSAQSVEERLIEQGGEQDAAGLSVA